MPCSCAAARREMLTVAPAAETAGTGCAKMFVGIGADPWKVQSPPGPEPSGPC